MAEQVRWSLGEVTDRRGGGAATVELGMRPIAERRWPRAGAERVTTNETNGPTSNGRPATIDRMPFKAASAIAGTAPPRARAGFSMLELVIALAMAAVLSAYAVPAYMSYAARGHRIDAVIALHRAAQHIAEHPSVAGRTPALPPGLGRAPEQGRTVYRLEMLSAGEGSGGYELHATPVDGGPMHGDACGTFVLDGLGARSNHRGAVLDGAAIDACWAGRAASSAV